MQWITPPYEGKELTAWPAVTMLRWEVVWDGKAFLGRIGEGQFLHCARPDAARPRLRNGGCRQWVGLE